MTVRGSVWTLGNMGCYLVFNFELNVGWWCLVYTLGYKMVLIKFGTNLSDWVGICRSQFLGSSI